jgi:hypothetical protein
MEGGMDLAEVEIELTCLFYRDNCLFAEPFIYQLFWGAGMGYSADAAI